MRLPDCLDRLVHPVNVYGCYRLTFGLARLFGIVPYHVDSSAGQLRLSWFGLANVIVRMIFYPLNFIYSCLERHTLMVSLALTNVSKFTADLEMFNGMAGIMAVLIASLLRRQELVQLMVLFDGLDSEAFPRVGISFGQIQAAREIAGSTAFQLCTLLGFVSYSFSSIFPIANTYASYSARVSYFSPNFIVCTVSILVSGLFIKLRIYLSALNEVTLSLYLSYALVNEYFYMLAGP